MLNESGMRLRSIRFFSWMPIPDDYLEPATIPVRDQITLLRKRANLTSGYRLLQSAANLSFIILLAWINPWGSLGRQNVLLIACVALIATNALVAKWRLWIAVQVPELRFIRNRPLGRWFALAAIVPRKDERRAHPWISWLTIISGIAALLVFLVRWLELTVLQ